MTRHKLVTTFASLISMILIGFFISGCGGVKSEYVAPNIIIPPHIKAISVRAFENQTSQPDIGNKLWLATTDEFIRDGRIRYTDDENKADGVVVGIVRQYVESPLSFDVNLVPREYQLWIIMDLKFLD